MINLRENLERSLEHHVYVVDKFPSFSETFVATEIESLIAEGVSVSVYSIHPPDADFKGVAPYIAKPLHAWQVLAWGLPALVLLAVHVAIGLRFQVRSLPRLFFASCHAFRLGVRMWSCPSAKNERAVLHAHFLARPADVVGLASLLAPGIPVLITSHAGDAKDRRDPDLRQWRVRRADHVLAASQFVKQQLADVASSRISVVHCGIAGSKLGVVTKPAEKLPHITVTTVARLIPTKGYSRAAGIVAALAERSGSKVLWNVVGDGPMRSDLEGMVPRLAKAHVDLRLHGALTHNAALALIAEGTVFLLPSSVTSELDNAGDGIPVAILEAMALGKLVVTTHAGGIPEAVENNRTGIMVSVEDDSEVADRILDVLNDPDLREQILHNAQEKIRREFSAEGSAAAIKEILASIRREDPAARVRRNRQR